MLQCSSDLSCLLVLLEIAVSLAVLFACLLDSERTGWLEWRMVMMVTRGRCLVVLIRIGSKWAPLIKEDRDPARRNEWTVDGKPAPNRRNGWRDGGLAGWLVGWLGWWIGRLAGSNRKTKQDLT